METLTAFPALGKTLKETRRLADISASAESLHPRNRRNVRRKSMSALNRLCSCRGGFTHADEHIVFPDSHLNPDFDNSPSDQSEMLSLFLLGNVPSGRCRLSVGLPKLSVHVLSSAGVCDFTQAWTVWTWCLCQLMKNGNVILVSDRMCWVLLL